jgi:hypothetical protein
VEPILIGYFPKQTPPPPPRPAAPPNVMECCNAGFCDHLAPKDWIDIWLHNEFWVFNTELMAWAVATQTENLLTWFKQLAEQWDGVPGSVQARMEAFIRRHVPPPGTCAEWESTLPRWELYAYRLFPALFVKGQPQEIRFPAMEVQPLPPDYERLGCDPVSVSAATAGEAGLGSHLSHSSLSPWCNGACYTIPVNRFCMIDTPEEGLRLAQEFSDGRGEPEPYVLVEVWRKRRAATA